MTGNALRSSEPWRHFSLTELRGTGWQTQVEAEWRRKRNMVFLNCSVLTGNKLLLERKEEEIGQ